jgi:hypothetical protein
MTAFDRMLLFEDGSDTLTPLSTKRGADTKLTDSRCIHTDALAAQPVIGAARVSLSAHPS